MQSKQEALYSNVRSMPYVIHIDDAHTHTHTEKNQQHFNGTENKYLLKFSKVYQRPMRAAIDFLCRTSEHDSRFSRRKLFVYLVH